MEQAAQAIIPHTHLLPKSEYLSIPSHKIPDIIGQGGKVIKDIIERFKVSIDIERENERICIQADCAQNLQNAKAFITQLVSPNAHYEIGEEVDGTIKRIMDFGVFISLPRGNDGLLHISKIPQTMQPLGQFFREGDIIRCAIAGNPKGKIELILC